MSYLDTLQNHNATDNDEKKKYTGDAVCEVVTAKIIAAKSDGTEYIVLEFSATHPIEPKGDKVCNIIYGDKLSKMYNTTDEKKMKAFANDMFTAGITIDSSSADAFAESLAASIGTLVYFRCWEASFVTDDGEKVEFNKLLIKSSKCITEEMRTPKVPF